MEQIGRIFNIEKFHIHDGAGIRTAVFLKGCHLRCPWCSNPESQSANRQVVVHQNLCVSCYRCERACPRKAIYHIGSKVKTNEEMCNFCGECVKRCPASARQIYGENVAVQEVMNEIMQDEAFYARSAGGVTITGGEPLLQADFVRALACACKKEYLSVAIETCGMVKWEQAWTGLEYADEILLDVKTTDLSKLDFILQGVREKEDYISLLRNNIYRLKHKGKNVIFRCPIIPEFNCTKSHVMSVVIWAKEFGVEQIDLLPFHQFGKHKYSSLGLNYHYAGDSQLRHEDMGEFRQLVERAGLCCTVGG
ncbi:MAG: glycyl-radical enzyme activating protein [Christensenella sp.]|nr:glycyl-radical enzyme activating protein [Christensenella sp.]